MIDKHREILYNIIGVAAVAQSVERRIGSAEVTGPIPVSSFIFSPKIKCLQDVKNERYSNRYSKQKYTGKENPVQVLTKDKSTTNRFIFFAHFSKKFSW